jgi:hypothetical protein
MAIQEPSEQVWLKEYEVYHSELLVMTKERYSILAIVITAIGITFGFATGAKGEWVVFLIPLIGLVVILPFAYLTFSISEHYHRITAYLEVFVEPKLGLKRELAWSIHYKEFHHVAFSKPIMIIYALLIFASSLFPLVYFLAKTVSGIAQAFTQYEIITVIEAFVGLVIGVFVWRRWGNVVTKPDAKARWEKVKQLMPVEKTSSKNNESKRTHSQNAASQSAQ